MKRPSPLHTMALRLLALAALAAAVLAPALARAVLVVDFDGIDSYNGITASKASNLALSPANVSGTNDYVAAYDPDAPISPTARYTGPAFYGAAWFTSSDGSVTSLTRSRVIDNPPIAESEIELGMVSHSGATSAGASLVAFQTGAPASTRYALGGDIGTLRLTISAGSQAVVRFAVESAGQWYVSMASDVPTSSGGGSLDLGGDPLNSLWAAWDPNGGANGRLADTPTTFDILGGSLTDIEAVGYFSTYNSSTSNQYASIDAFSADLDAVAAPEPSTVAMLSLGVAGLLLAVVRRRGGLPAGK